MVRDAGGRGWSRGRRGVQLTSGVRCRKTCVGSENNKQRSGSVERRIADRGTDLRGALETCLYAGDEKAGSPVPGSRSSVLLQGVPAVRLHHPGLRKLPWGRRDRGRAGLEGAGGGKRKGHSRRGQP